MWHCTRLVYFHEVLHYHSTDRIIQQSLQQNALAIAQTYKDKERWVSAAQNLRAPYWDWATNSVPPPEVISLTTVTISAAPDGNPTDVTNPLYQYTFHPIDPSFTSTNPNRPPYQDWQTTIRSPDDPFSSDATTDVTLLTEYDLPLPDSSISHSVFKTGICRHCKTTSPRVPTTFSRVLMIGLLSATTHPAMAAALATLWKAFMTRFMVTLVVKWATPPLLVGELCVGEFLGSG